MGDGGKRYAVDDSSLKNASSFDCSSCSYDAAIAADVPGSAAEALRQQQRLRRQRRIEIIRRKRNGLSRSTGSPSEMLCSNLTCYSGSSCASTVTPLVDVVAEAEVEIPAHLSAKEIRKLKNRLSAERSRNRKLGLIDALASQVKDLTQQHDRMMRDNAELQQLLASPPASWVPLLCSAAAIAAGIPREVVFSSSVHAADDTSSCSSLSAPPSPSLVSAAPSELPVNFDMLPAFTATPSAAYDDMTFADSVMASNGAYDLDDVSLSLLDGDLEDVPQQLLLDPDMQEFLRLSPEPTSMGSCDWDSDEFSNILDSFEMLV